MRRPATRPILSTGRRSTPRPQPDAAKESAAKVAYTRTSRVRVLWSNKNFSRRNHRRHLITRHKCRPDGTPATPADVEDAQRGDPVQPPKRDTKYNSRDFVDTDSDDDTTTAASGASTPSDKRSPSPPRGRRQKRARSESCASPSPQRDTRRVVPRSPKVPSPVTSRAVTPPRVTSPRRKQVRRVRFERGTKTTEGESKESAKQPAAKSTRQTATA